ncbi:mitochondrial division protein Mda1 [Dorcoceras hygrometricum]|uniref:Mitochondrial division protein Mda1 n=1 Tax=Dorcoceras hygrometricum TaxID=472368 RepID=A0A2Z7C063_9LAMI|nr:mitochondrial division protein Mda1 [Dorcoceras hygrometricum]
MPPKRRGRASRQAVVDSKTPVSADGEDASEPSVPLGYSESQSSTFHSLASAVNRVVDLMERLVVGQTRVQQSTGQSVDPVPSGTSSSQPSVASQSLSRQRFRPRGRQFKRSSSSSCSEERDDVLTGGGCTDSCTLLVNSVLFPPHLFCVMPCPCYSCRCRGCPSTIDVELGVEKSVSGARILGQMSTFCVDRFGKALLALVVGPEICFADALSFCGLGCFASSRAFVFPFDSSAGLGELSGLPGYSAGLGVDPTEVAPGGIPGFTAVRGFSPAGGAPGGG